MKKYLLLLILLLTSCTPTSTQSIVQDTGSIEVYFCPQDDCKQQLVNFLKSANQSIHCALFDIGLKSIQNALDQKSKEMEVQVVTDNNYLKKYKRSFVKADKYGLMHHKYCVVDDQYLFTGSMNPTENGAYKNNNNILFIESKVLAQNYEQEFQEMWQGVFKKGGQTPNSVVQLNNITIQNYFCPEDHCTHKVKQELKKAKHSIHFMIFSFTSNEVANILLLKHQDNVTVQGVMEARQVTKYSEYERLKYNVGTVYKDTNKNNMHHKTFIIDNETVITGSYNPSNNANKNNDENMLIIKDKRIARKYLEELKTLNLDAS